MGATLLTAVAIVSTVVLGLALRFAVLRERKLRQTLDERTKDLLRASTRLEAANRELGRIASLDGLTGVASRTLFDEVLVREWRRLTRYNLPLTLILIDVDSFSAYNECNTHRAGDDCLRKVAAHLTAAVNRPGDLVARYAADEFAVLLAGTEPTGGITMADTLRTGVAKLGITRTTESEEPVTVSVGVATVIPWEGMVPTALVDRAEWALARARKRGANRTEIYAA
jgi:diguanylate cyclase (GGDEF)-like protein